MNLSPAGKPWKTESSQLGAEEAGYLSPGSRLRAASQGINSLAFRLAWCYACSHCQTDVLGWKAQVWLLAALGEQTGG